MIARVVAWSARHPWIVIALAFLVCASGALGGRALSRDAVPDLADPQIVLVADWMGHPATEVASGVTQILTKALDGVAGATAIRGSSMSGMAYIDVVFSSASNLDRARAAVLQRIAHVAAELPPNVRVQVGPAASSAGWVFQYALLDRSNREPPLPVRRLQEDILRPALLSIPGVAEVATVGGHGQQVLIEAKAGELRERGLAFTDVLTALRPVLQARDLGAPLAVTDLENIPVAVPGATGASLRITDVGRIRVEDEMPSGLADFGGVFEAVGGIVLVRRDANLTRVIAAVKQKLHEARAQLPGALEIVTVYDRTELADRAEHTMAVALAEEVGAVVVVVLVFLLHARSALVPLLTLPAVLFLALAAMWLLGVPATIMSLGGIGIALGIAVDADVVALEACHRGLETSGPGLPTQARRRALLAAAGAFAPAIVTSLVITALSFLPVFAFSGETGRLLWPLALTKTLVIASASVVALTLAPALRDRLLFGSVTPEFHHPLTRGLVKIYRPFVHFALSRPALTLTIAAMAVASCLPIAARLGGEFLPRIDEGDLLFMPTTLPGVTPEQAAWQLGKQDRAIAAFGEVSTVFGKVGRADTATDPAPFSMAETTVRLRPRSSWPAVARTRWYSAWAPPWMKRALGLLWPEQTPETATELVERLDRATRRPGWTNAWSAPARARMDMTSTGIRTPVGIRVVAADPARLDALGIAMRALAMRVPGARSAVFESLGRETWLSFEPDSEAMARHRVDPAWVKSTSDLVLSGGQVGQIALEGRLVRLRVLPDVDVRGPADELRDVLVRAEADHTGQPVPLALLGRAALVTRPAMVRSEGARPVAYVYVDLSPGADPVGYVGRAQRELDRSLLAKEVHLGEGERIEWAGQYDLFAACARRLRWIVPFVVFSMLGLLFLQFRSFTEALIVLASVPFAIVGSLWTLYFLGYPLSAPVWVGLLSTIGMAMQTGVVMVVYIDQSFHQRVREGRIQSREDIVAAHAEGTVKRLRPKMMTVTTMAAGLLPLLWADGAGAEIMRRVAAPMIGGLATSAFLTLEVLPVLYTVWRHRQLREAVRLKTSIASVVGTGPSWARATMV
jgi:copper/silver efflux system protein